MPIYFGMRVIITENRDKAGGFVNGNIGVVHFHTNHTSFVCCNHQLVAIFPVTNQQNDTYYPIQPVYSMTVAKAQGQTIPHVTIWFDKPKSSTASAYVAMSRVASFSCISFLSCPWEVISHKINNSISFSLLLLLRAGAIGLHCSEGPAISKSLTMSCCYLFG